ncbi:MAG: Outer membrane efflux protein [uncultured Aureispira sp.]|uniref:Outer membrane efflux protein n=1 Tax=uncultured Aureispira sp. TaxID=1331704 RepID=A0A6S6S0M8_9BACT|nr:MAG: Outer membrane efflux protein [uncultured Aureispira sp.]
MKKLNSLIIVLIITITGIQAQELEQFSLLEAIAYAQRKSNSVRTAELDVARAKADVQEYTSIGIPKLNAGVDYNYYVHIPTSLIPNDAFVIDIPGLNIPPPEPGYSETQFGTRNNLTLGVNLNTLVVDGSYFVGLKASKGLMEMTKRQADLTKYDIKHVIVKAYLQVLIAEQSRDVLLQNIENIEKVIAETRIFLENGMVEKLDLDRLELSMLNLEVQIEMLERQIELAHNVLKFQMNYPLEGEIELMTKLEDVFTLPDAADLEGKITSDRRIETDIMKQTIRLNELNTKRFTMGYLPSLSAFAVHQQVLQRDDLFDGKQPGFYPTTIIGLKLNVPIFDGFEKAAKIKKSRIDVEKFKLQLDDLERGITLEVRNARAVYNNATKRLVNQDENLALAERILKTTRIKYREGVGSSIEMTQAEQELYRTQANRLNALYELVVAKADLDKALGK